MVSQYIFLSNFRQHVYVVKVFYGVVNDNLFEQMEKSFKKFCHVRVLFKTLHLCYYGPSYKSVR